MNIKNRLGRAGGIAAAAVVIGGHYVTAVGGGGRTTDTIHTDATVIRAWELFRVACVAA